MDRDGDGEFDSKTEPALIQLVDLEKKALRPVLTEVQLDTLQRLLEGR